MAMPAAATAACSQASQTGATEHERVRAYEIAAYLAAASFPFDMAGGPPDNPAPSSDLTLNALVQHGTNMMDCDRAFLSLIDNRSQYICAEMTREQPLTRQNPERPLLLGTSRIPLEWGVCPYTMSVFHGKTDALPPNPYIVADPSYFYIKDFREVPSFAVRPYVAGYPKMVSYIEVPLRSLSGHILGSYCVVDDRPRDFLLPASLETIREVALAISSYLDMKRVEISRTRSVRMMDGLNQFIASERPLSSPYHDNLESGGVPAGPFDLGVFRRSSSSGTDDAAKLGQFSQMTASSPKSRHKTREHDPGSSSKAALAGIPNSSNGSSSTMSEHRHETSVTTDIPHSANTPQQMILEPGRPDPPPKADDLFQRAAKTIGFALNVDGLVFFDTGRASTLRSESRVSSLFMVDEYAEPIAHVSDMAADILSEYRSDGLAETQLTSKPSQLTIQHLTARYPQGHVFVADEYGVMDYDVDPHDETVQDATNGPAVDNDQREILECVPKARYAMFLPLWHYQRESCFATCLVWVSNPAKTLDSGDVNSLTAFGNSLMVEILRQESLTNSQTKSDFISSISHELRSPLHGIMATTELIQESVEDLSLLSMMDMIESCSATLLDTFDHLLEFAKINGRTRNSHPADSKSHFKTPSESKKVVVDLRELLEDMVEVVTLGHSHSLQMSSGLRKEQQFRLPDGNCVNPHSPVLVTSCVESNRDWKLLLDTGAWKRIILNILSNALKYTNSGYIDIRLKMSGETEDGARHITFSVTDTGIGMSREFVKYHIFTAFMQEDSLSPGTGLGLSLVKTIVDSLEGNISVDSCPGEGTCITIDIPIDNGIESSKDSIREETSTSNRLLQGLSFGLVSVVSLQPETSGNVPLIVSPPKVIQNLVRNICQEENGVNVLSVSAEAVPETDVVMLDTHALTSTDSLDWEHFFSKTLPLKHHPHLIVLGPTIERLEQYTGMTEITYINSPITGKKFRSALYAAENERNTSPMPELQNLSDQMEKTSIEAPDQDLDVKTITKKNDSFMSTSSTSEEQQKKGPKHPPFVRHVSIPTITSRFKRFLLVDDNPINLKVLAAFITRVGRPFSTASDGAQAVQLYRDAALGDETPYDCIFMDISMPIMDGFQAIAEIRRLEKQMSDARKDDSSDVPYQSYIMALTGLGSDEARRAARDSGVDGFLLKPIKFKDVMPLL